MKHQDHVTFNPSDKTAIIRIGCNQIGSDRSRFMTIMEKQDPRAQCMELFLWGGVDPVGELVQ